MMSLSNSMRLLTLLPRPLASSLSSASSASSSASANEVSSLTRPKRPSTSLNCFIQDRYSAVKASMPAVTKSSQRMVELSRQWEQLSDAERRPFVEKAEESSRVYKEEMEKFKETLKKSNLLEEYYAQMSAARAAKLDKKIRRETRSLNQKLNKPKRPTSAFILFHMDLASKKGTGEMSMAEFFKAAASQWSNMSASEKSPYMDRYKSLREQYYLDMAAWEERVKDTPEMEQIEKIKKAKKK